MAKPVTFAWLVLLFLWVGGPADLAAQGRAGVTHGPLSGEVTDSSVVLWARGSEAGTLTFTVATLDGEEVASASVDIADSSDFTGDVAVDGLAPGTPYEYTVVHSRGGDARTGSFATAPERTAPEALRFLFGACLGGQGYCRSPETGWAIFETMAEESPDFFVMVGDGVYVDSACPVDDGRNVPGAEEIATDLAGFRDRYKYHLDDPAYAAFLAQTPVLPTWDDHEILDNFGGPELLRINPALFEEGREAFFDFWPLPAHDEHRIYRSISYGAHADLFLLDTRSYRDPLVNWDPSPVTGVHKSMLGEEQFEWLTAGLAESSATWKFVVTSVPIGYPTGFPQPQVDGRDGWANGGDRSGYEHEMMRLMFYLAAHDVKNVVFITGDTHWPFAVDYDPDGDGTANFLEIGASPLAAIPLAPGDIDQTFGPEVLYAEGEFMGDLFNFGAVDIDEDGGLTLRIVDDEGTERFAVQRQPEK